MFLPWSFSYFMEDQEATLCFKVFFRGWIQGTCICFMWTAVAYISSQRFRGSMHQATCALLWQPERYLHCCQSCFPWTHQASWDWLSYSQRKIASWFVQTAAYFFYRSSCRFFHQIIASSTISSTPIQVGVARHLPTSNLWGDNKHFLILFLF